MIYFLTFINSISNTATKANKSYLTLSIDRRSSIPLKIQITLYLNFFALNPSLHSMAAVRLSVKQELTLSLSWTYIYLQEMFLCFGAP